MISIYCDEDVDVLIKPLLEAKGFKVLTTLDKKMLGASDIQQIDNAIKTEFLPVSSSAHLIIFPWLFGWQGTVDTMSFDVALHFGTLIALLSYFREDWITLLRTANRKDGMIWHIIIGTVPAGFAGILFHKEITGLRSPLLIVFTLCAVAVLMIFVEAVI